MQTKSNTYFLPSLSWWESSVGRCEAEGLIYQPTTCIWLSWSCYTIAEKKDKKNQQNNSKQLCSNHLTDLVMRGNETLWNDHRSALEVNNDIISC